MSSRAPGSHADAVAAMRQFLTILGGGVRELRFLKVPQKNGSVLPFNGFFDADHTDAFVHAVLDLGRTAAGVYVSLNELIPDVLLRRGNRTAFCNRGDCTAEADVARRRWLFIDIDPVRTAGISATDAEKAWGVALADRVLADLTARGWPAPVRIDSGNGVYLLYAVDLPAKDGGLVQKVLAALAKRFDTAEAKIDTVTHDAARVLRLPGSVNRKGDAIPERPHRPVKFVSVPDVVGVVSDELLRDLAAEAAPKTALAVVAVPRTRMYDRRLKVGEWLAAHGVAFREKTEPDAKGRRVFVLEHCPFNPDHRDPDACVMQAEDGGLSAKCFHTSCDGKGWKYFKAAIGAPEPHHFDPPLQPHARAYIGGGPAAPAPAAAATGAGPCDLIRISGDEPAGDVVAAVTAALADGGGCYDRAGQLVRVAGDAVHHVLDPHELAGVLCPAAEVLVGRGNKTAFRPLPANYGHLWLNHPTARAGLPTLTLFTRHPVFGPDWRVAPAGFDPATGIYTAGPAVPVRTGTQRLDALLADFCFAAPADLARYMAAMLTALVVPHCIGAKPLVLLSANRPGLGKSALAQILAVLRDGRAAGTVTYTPNDEEFEKRLGAAVRKGGTVVIIDNAKTAARAPKIESACLERSVTDPDLNFRLVGFSEEIRAENQHTFCITANTPQVGPDIVSRSLPVRLHYEGDPKRRKFGIAEPMTYARAHRIELLGELVGLVEAWKAAGMPRPDRPFRFRPWAAIVGGILDVAGLPDFLDGVDEAAADADPDRRDFADLLAAAAETGTREWTASELADLAYGRHILTADPGRDNPRSRATRLGKFVGGYLGEVFTLPDGQAAALTRDGCHRIVYRLIIET